jgi:hypothetical protein
MSAREKHPGIDVRQSKGKPSYRAEVYDPSTGRKIRKTFHTLAAARGWRADASARVRRGDLRAPSGQTIREASEQWLSDARAKIVTNRSGDGYTPSILHSYALSLRKHVYPAMGPDAVEDLTSRGVNGFVDRLRRKGLSASTM